MTAFYNEWEPYPAQWLRNLSACGMIAPGDVSEESIEDLLPDDLARYEQVHLFAGIGLWSAALRRIGWPDTARIWSCSCPCQPFSAAGKGAGFADERHLWPAVFHLVTQCWPDIVVGEQVASPDGLVWLDLVQTDMERAGYTFRAVDLCAAGFGAPHIRQRLYWVAKPYPDGRKPGRQGSAAVGYGQAFDANRGFVRMGFTASCGRQWIGDKSEHREFMQTGKGKFGGMAKLRTGEDGAGTAGDHRLCDMAPWPGPTNGEWRDVDWLFCRDGKWRPVRSGSFPLSHGRTSRVGALRAYGNAIVLPQAEEFLRAALL